ncbi:hypothetical protein BV25DRAFT_1828309 [Artomyces pyxidatus]|uniref:Uncharacterized protein n=1 Tax=Artomyces pyxidatus TaxID=48021 RepID=A0ACB8SUC6_9AGAM|nr:hypothetical protein BV25DRAFT_1828309 [Artomyces pyxidatus]
MSLIKVPLIFIAFTSYNLALFRPQSANQEEQARTAKDNTTTLVDKGTYLVIGTSRVGLR